MSRRDYMLIAGIINDMTDPWMREQCAKAFAYELQKHDRSFKLDLFMLVCMDASKARTRILNMDKHHTRSEHPDDE